MNEYDDELKAPDLQGVQKLFLEICLPFEPSDFPQQGRLA